MDPTANKQMQMHQARGSVGCYTISIDIDCRAASKPSHTGKDGPWIPHRNSPPTNYFVRTGTFESCCPRFILFYPILSYPIPYALRPCDLIRRGLPIGSPRLKENPLGLESSPDRSMQAGEPGSRGVHGVLLLGEIGQLSLAAFRRSNQIRCRVSMPRCLDALAVGLQTPPESLVGICHQQGMWVIRPEGVCFGLFAGFSRTASMVTNIRPDFES